MSVDDRLIVAERMKSLRLAHSLSLSAIGDIVGVTYASVSRYESGMISPRKTIIEKYSLYFKVSPLWLLGLSDEKHFSPSNDPVRVTVFGSIKPGVPVQKQTDIISYTWVTSEKGVNFGLRISDDSMINARLLEGDTVLVRTQNTVENNDIAVVMLDGNAIIRRIIKINDMVVLHPENPSYDDFIYSKRDQHEMRIIGKVKILYSEV